MKLQLRASKVNPDLDIEVASFDEVVARLRQYTWWYDKATLLDDEGYLQAECKRQRGALGWDISLTGGRRT